VQSIHLIDHRSGEVDQLQAKPIVKRRPVLDGRRFHGAHDVRRELHRDRLRKEEWRKDGPCVLTKCLANLSNGSPAHCDICELSPSEAPDAVRAVCLALIAFRFTSQHAE
jgi:hypothetical protein